MLNVVSFESFKSHGDDETELWKANITFRTDVICSVSEINSFICNEDDEKLMEVHVTAPRQNNAFLTENRPSLT